MVSRYYSHRNSHDMLNPSLENERKILTQLSPHEGLLHMISELGGRVSALQEALFSWVGADKDERILLFRYEDLTGPDQEAHFRRLMDHCEIHLKSTELKRLLRRHSFRRMSHGRNPGEEDTDSHYRRGVPGDWHSHFSPEHQRVFSEVSGDLLERLGYEAE